MLQKLLFLIFLFMSLNAYSEPSYSGDSLQKIYLEMRFLHHLGVDIHQRYNFSDREQIKACNFEAEHNLTRARALVGSTNRIDYPDKGALIEAAWATYSCASCKGDGTVCDSIPAQLKNIRNVIKQSRLTQ